MKFILAMCLILMIQNAFAARPFVTDDARLTTAGSCQLETWTRVYKTSAEYWALPACNPTGNFEVTVGTALAKADNERFTHDYLLQVKTLFKPLETNSYGIGFAIGAVSHPEEIAGPNQFGNTYLYVPASFSFADDQIIIHINLGLLRYKDMGKKNLTWGIGGELKLIPNLLGIAELYGDNRDNPFAQIGFRYSLKPNLFQIDTTYGQQVNGQSENQWISFGLRFTPDSVF